MFNQENVFEIPVCKMVTIFPASMCYGVTHKQLISMGEYNAVADALVLKHQWPLLLRKLTGD